MKLTDKGYLYGQFATDGPGEQRFAYQAGMRWFVAGSTARYQRNHEIFGGQP